MSGKAAKTAKSHVDEVSMMIGTDGSHETEYGGTTPAVGSPFAMTQWCAATRLNGISHTMYRRCDSVLIGFMGTHQPAIWMGDYGFMTLMPQSGELKIKATDRQVRLEHGKEVAGGVSKRRILFFYKQSPDFHKPGLCHVQKILYL